MGGGCLLDAGYFSYWYSSVLLYATHGLYAEQDFRPGIEGGLLRKGVRSHITVHLPPGNLRKKSRVQVRVSRVVWKRHNTKSP